MVYASEHMLLQWTGTFAKSEGAAVYDEFAGTLRFAGSNVAAADNQATCDALADVLRTWWPLQYSYTPTVASLGAIKWNRIRPDGKYANRNQTTVNMADNWRGGGAVTRYPLQVAWVATWLTNFGRGRASKGRTYFPTAVPVDSNTTGRVPAELCGNFALSCATLLADLNDAAQSQGSGIVASVMSNLDEGVTAPITGVRVGDRLDIQRRRDNSVEETYQTRWFGGDEGQAEVINT